MMERLQKQNNELMTAFKFWRTAAFFMLVVSAFIMICTTMNVNKIRLAATQSELEYKTKLESVEHIRDIAVEQLGVMAQKVDELEAELAAIITVESEASKTDSSTTELINTIENCAITYYCAEKYPHICGLGLGVTATGVECNPGHIVAVDPNVIPLHSKVIVDYGDGELHSYYAEDVGGSIKGNHIDVMCETHNEALNAGKRTATVYWIEQEEQ